MNNQRFKQTDNEDINQAAIQSLKMEKNKITESYRSHFYRNGQQLSEFEPSQSSQNKHSRAKDRLKSTRIRDRNPSSIYYELESTKKNQTNSLREENTELKKIIAELKVQQFYHIDQNKLKTLFLQIDSLKEELKKIQKQNQRLRIQNDFLTRTNFQLKLQSNKLLKIYEKNQHANEDFKLNEFISQNKYLDQQQRPTSSTNLNLSGIPQHLLLAPQKKVEASLLPNLKFKSDLQFKQIHLIPKKITDSTTLSRIRSEKILLNNQRSKEKIKISKKKNIYTEIENDHSKFH